MMVYPRWYTAYDMYMTMLIAILIALELSTHTTRVDGMTMTIKKPHHRHQRRSIINHSRRDVFHKAASIVGVTICGIDNNIANAVDETNNIPVNQKQIYNQRFPTLFDPLYGQGIRRTIKRQVGTNIWSLEQNLQLGPLQTPIRCVVIQLDDGSLWVHAPLAPTEEFFELVESCGSGIVKHIVVPTYALEHKIFVKDAIERWKDARLWTSPGQFSFPIRSISSSFVFGKEVDGVLSSETSSDVIPPWANEIQYETLAAGTYNIGGKETTFYETAFFHIKSKSLIVTDAVAKIPKEVPELNDPELLLLVSKQSTSDPQPEDTYEQRLIGWKKTALLVSYFFPEHEEPDPNKFGVVTWTPGWENNFQQLSDRLITPPVVRTLIYAQNPKRVKEWVDKVSSRWQFEQIIPAHFEAPIKTDPDEFKRTFRFLEDDSIDAFPEKDLARGLKPIADIALGSTDTIKVR